MEDAKLPPEFQEDARAPLIEPNSTDSTELWLIQWPKDQISLDLHHDDGRLGTVEGSSGKSYDVVSLATQEPKATVFLSAAADSKIETPRSSNSSLKRANTNVVSSKVTSQSSGSSLLPELEMRLEEACYDLVCHNMLNLRDVAYAESYLTTSTWASSIFLQQEDLEKRSAMIINAQKNAEEKKKRRKMGACRKY